MNRQLGSLAWMFVGFGLVAALWYTWHALAGRSLPGFLGYRYERRGLRGRSLRLYSVLQLIGAIGLIVLGVGLAYSSWFLVALGLAAVVVGVGIDVAMFAPKARRVRR